MCPSKYFSLKLVSIRLKENEHCLNDRQMDGQTGRRASGCLGRQAGRQVPHYSDTLSLKVKVEQLLL